MNRHAQYMSRRSLGRFLKVLEGSGELLHVNEPIDCALEAGCIADKLVKRGGPAVIFEQPRLARSPCRHFAF